MLDRIIDVVFDIPVLAVAVDVSLPLAVVAISASFSRYTHVRGYWKIFSV